MITLLIICVLAIGLVTVLAQAVMGLYGSLGTIATSQHESRLADLWSDAIKSQLVPFGPNSKFIAPLGAEVRGYGRPVHGLPEHLPVPHQNSMGLPVHYCAMGYDATPEQVQGLNEAVIALSEVSSYRAYISEHDGKQYVFSGNPGYGMTKASENIVAFIVSPLELAFQKSCSDIRYDAASGRHFIPNSMSRVIPVYAPHVFAHEVSAP